MTDWTIDSSHSSIDFKVRHMGLAFVRGRFTSFEGKATTERGELKAVEATIDAASIDTNDEKRDGHLRSPDFFDVETFPQITFESTRVEKAGRDTYRVTGDLSMRGQTHPVTFEAEVGDPVKDPWGMTRAAATVKGKLNRTKWGLKWNQVLEAGSLLVGEEISFDFDVQATAAEKEAQAV